MPFLTASCPAPKKLLKPAVHRLEVVAKLLGPKLHAGRCPLELVVDLFEANKSVGQKPVHVAAHRSGKGGDRIDERLNRSRQVVGELICEPLDVRAEFADLRRQGIDPYRGLLHSLSRRMHIARRLTEIGQRRCESLCEGLRIGSFAALKSPRQVETYRNSLSLRHNLLTVVDGPRPAVARASKQRCQNNECNDQ